MLNKEQQTKTHFIFVWRVCHNAEAGLLSTTDKKEEKKPPQRTFICYSNETEARCSQFPCAAGAFFS